MTLKIKRSTISAKHTVKQRRGFITEEWHGYPIIKAHNPNIVVRALAKFIQNKPVVSIGLVGDSGSGKSTTARFLAHGLHTVIQEPWVFREFAKEEMTNAYEILEELPKINTIALFDDISYSHTQVGVKKWQKCKKYLTQIRHKKPGLKVCLIFNVHYSRAADKHTRDTNYWGFTSLGREEMTNVVHQVNHSARPALRAFSTRIAKAPQTGKTHYQLNDGSIFTYKYRDPFTPAFMTLPGKHLEMFVPLILDEDGKPGIAPNCPTCLAKYGKPIKVEPKTTESIIQQMIDSYGTDMAKTALKAEFWNQGKNMYTPKMASAKRLAAKLCQNVSIDYELVHEMLDLKKRNKKNVVAEV